MAYIFSELQAEVARRGTKNQGGSTFTTPIKNLINTSIERIAREANWKILRRSGKFYTVAPYITGTVSCTNGSTLVAGSGTLWLTGTAPVVVGRRMSLGGSNQRYTIVSINSDTSINVDYTFDGTTASGLTYTIYGQEEYNLPIQTNKEAILQHEKLGYPYVLQYITERQFYASAVNTLVQYTPTHYHMWLQDTVIAQPTSASVVTCVSSSSADTGQGQTVTVFGTVAGYPDSETITITGTSGAVGSKSFTNIDRVTKNATTTGRITTTSNSSGTIVAVIPTGYQTDSIRYKKVKLFPLVDSAFPIYVDFYKQPYRLVNDGDIHELGDAFDEAIILLATAKLKLESNIDEGTKFMALFQDELKSLKQYNVDKLDWLATLLKPGQYRYGTNRINRFLSYQQLGGGFGPSAVA